MPRGQGDAPGLRRAIVPGLPPIHDRYCSAVTAQIPDSLDVDSRSLSIQGVRGEGLFDPEALGWETHGTSSDNWRGYVARYAVAGERLVLRQLSIDFALGFLEMREPIWALELRSPVGPSRKKPNSSETLSKGREWRS